MGMSSASDSQFHVLAVDDSLIDRKLIEKLLKTSSYQVTAVDSATKALEFLGWHEDDGTCNSNHSIDETLVSSNNHHQMEVNLVITDYCMPGMTGYDLLKKIKESSNLRNIPVVIMSSENVPSRISRCLEEGAEEFFLKPVSRTDVNKLKHHMMKTKCKIGRVRKPENMEKQESLPTEGDEIVTVTSEKQWQSQQQQTEQSSIITPSASSNNNNNKRKSVEDRGLSPERSRPRFSNGLTVMSN